MAEIEHNTGVEEGAAVGVLNEVTVRAQDLPMVITLVLENGTKKRYSLGFAKKAEGLILNKAV